MKETFPSGACWRKPCLAWIKPCRNCARYRAHDPLLDRECRAQKTTVAIQPRIKVAPREKLSSLNPRWSGSRDESFYFTREFFRAPNKHEKGEGDASPRDINLYGGPGKTRSSGNSRTRIYPLFQWRGRRRGISGLERRATCPSRSRTTGRGVSRQGSREHHPVTSKGAPCAKYKALPSNHEKIEYL